MILVTQNGVVTIAPWWEYVQMEPVKLLEVQLTHSNGSVMRIAKFTSKKKAQALHSALNIAIQIGQSRFDIKKWEVEYSSNLSSKNEAKSS